jgi:GNAT superfamily N-acetyltransferase
VRIVPFSPALAPAFAALNRDWIERLFALEEADLKTLGDPQSSIIAPGGQVFFALDSGNPVGTAAAIAASPARFELSKMAVAPSHQGRGIGRLLGETVIDWARARNAETLFLFTSSRLPGAIRLYERLGFEHGQLPRETGYARADVYMTLSLRTRSK